MAELLEITPSDTGFIDAARIWQVLQAVHTAPLLLVAIAQRFQSPDRSAHPLEGSLPPSELNPTPPPRAPQISAPPWSPGATTPPRAIGTLEEEPQTDEASLQWLLREGFLAIHGPTYTEIMRAREGLAQSEKLRSQRVQWLRRQQQIQEELLRLERSSGVRGLLSSRSKESRWEISSQKERLQAELQTIAQSLPQHEASIRQLAQNFKRLHEQVHTVEYLREYTHWAFGRPLTFCYNGRFLHSYLAGMSPTHFHGRSLSEILQVGPLLA